MGKGEKRKGNEAWQNETRLLCPLACVVVLNGTYYLRQLYTNTYAHKHVRTRTHTYTVGTHTCHSLRRAVTRRNKILLRRFIISAQRGNVSQVTKGQRWWEGGVARAGTELVLPSLLPLAPTNSAAAYVCRQATRVRS